MNDKQVTGLKEIEKNLRKIAKDIRDCTLVSENDYNADKVDKQADLLNTNINGSGTGKN